MEDKLFSDMPSAPKPPKLPKHFPDLQGSLRGRTPEAGWYQNDFLPWIQNEEVKNFLGYGFGMALVIGLGALMGIGIYTYQDEIQNFGNEIQEWGNELMETTMGYSEAAMEKISTLVGVIKEKIMNLCPTLSNQEQVNEARSMFDKIKDVMPFGQREPEVGE